MVSVHEHRVAAAAKDRELAARIVALQVAQSQQADGRCAVPLLERAAEFERWLLRKQEVW
jgi:hypothetical protein